MAEKIKKRTGGVICLLMLLAIMLCGFVLTDTAEASQQAGTITVSVEKFTIGQGYYIEPEEVPFYEGDTGASIVDRLLGGPDGYKGTYDDEKGFYLASIYGADPSGVATIPRCISEMDPLAPSTEYNVGNADVPNLGEFAYSEKAGWMYSVNGAFPRVGLSRYEPKDGDVMRLQFTVWALGGDLGDDYTADRIDVAKREALTKAVAAFNGRDDKDALLSKVWISDAYEKAMSVLVDMERSQEEVDHALSWFERAMDAKSLSGIKLDNESIELGVGGTAALNVIFEPEGCNIPESVQWESSDMDIAYVDSNGLVSAGMEGTAVITASVGDFSAVCTVNVKPQVPMTGISLSKKQASLGKKDTVDLTIRYEPADTTDDRSAVWTSSDDAVASVDQSGRVTAHAFGEAAITAQVGNFSGQCLITVIDNGQDIVDAVVEEIKALNEQSDLNQVAKAQRDFLSLSESQMGLLKPAEVQELQMILNSSMNYVISNWSSAMRVSLQNAGKELEKGGLADQTLFDFIQLYNDYETLNDLEGIPEANANMIAALKEDIDSMQKKIGSENRTSSGVTVSEARGIPWTVQVKAKAAELTQEERKAIEEDWSFYQPQICSAFKIELRDFGAAESPDKVPQWDASGRELKVLMPAGDYKQSLTDRQNLTVISGAERKSLDGKRAYNAQRHTVTIENADIDETLIFVCDSRIPITEFVLSDEEVSIMLDNRDPSHYLSVKTYKPYDTTDKERILWSSSNPEVASVDSQGKVTGHVKGEALITADICGLKQTCKITVKMNALPDYQSFWPTFRKSNSNMAIVDVELPNTGENLTEKWIQDGMVKSRLGTVGTPLNVNGKLYVSADDYLYRLNKETGEIEKKAKMCGKVGYFSYATYGDGMIFVPIDGGIVEAFNAETMDSLWRTERMGGQSLCQLTYYDGLMYSGTWSGGSNGNSGKFYCYDTTKNGEQSGNVKKPKWVSDDQNGYYWSGATIVGDAVIFGGDSGRLQSRNRVTGELIDAVQCEGMIRSCISYDEGTSSVYFTAGVGDFTGGADEGKVYKAGVTSGGKFTSIQGTQLPAASTTTPVVYNGRVYVPTGKGFEYEGKMSVLDANTMSIIYNAEIGGSSKASPLLTTAYSDDGQKTVYLYMTVNNIDGAVIRMKDWEGNDTPQVEVIYRPDVSQREHTTASLYCDEDGTIFYYNDQGHLMALTGTTDRVRDSAGVIDGRRPGQGGDGSNAAGRAAIQKAAADAKEAFEPWKFDGNYVAPGKSVSKQSANFGEKLKKAAAVLSLSAVGMAVAYTAGAAMLQLKPSLKPRKRL